MLNAKILIKTNLYQMIPAYLVELQKSLEIVSIDMIKAN